MRTPLPGLILALAFCSAPLLSEAQAAGFLETRFAFGARDFSSVSMDAVVASSGAAMVGAGVTSFSERRFSSAVQAARFVVSRPFGETALGVRGIAYPTVSDSSAYGGTFFLQRRSSGSEEDFEAAWGLSLSHIAHHLRNEPTAPPKRNQRFGEYVVEFNTRQSYFEEFNFQLTGAGFFYDKNLSKSGIGITNFRTQFAQSEVATLGTYAPLTEPPQWNVSLQYSRATVANGPTAVVLGYSRIGLYVDGRSANSYLFGVQTKVGDSLTAQVGYNHYKVTRTAGRNYYGATLTYYWK